MRAAKVMTSPVITVAEQTPVSEAAAILTGHGFTSVPVVDGAGQMTGIVSESDLMRDRVRPEGWPAQPEHADPAVGTVMTKVPLALRPDADLADVVSLMLAEPVRAVPIVEDGRLVGIITRRDVLRALERGGTGLGDPTT